MDPLLPPMPVIVLAAALAVVVVSLAVALVLARSVRTARTATEALGQSVSELARQHQEIERLCAALRTDIRVATRPPPEHGTGIQLQPAPASENDTFVGSHSHRGRSDPPTLRMAAPAETIRTPIPVAAAEAPEQATLIFAPAPAAPRAADAFHGMAVLRIKEGVDSGREFKLPFERCTIGRATTNRVVLAEEKASRVHAEIRFEKNRFIFKDLGSTNGSVLNGVPVEEGELSFGDIVTIGRTELLFTCEGFDLKDTEPAQAIAAFERMLERQEDNLAALQNLAFLLERNVARRREADGLWRRLKELEG